MAKRLNMCSSCTPRLRTATSLTHQVGRRGATLRRRRSPSSTCANIVCNCRHGVDRASPPVAVRCASGRGEG
eukprot:2224847-Pyramimonas_sp.AAC.2